MIDFGRRVVFIHIPKTGGESLASLFDDGGPAMAKHATARQLRAFLGERDWQDFYKFSVVRNPFDQVASMYSHLRKPLYQRENILRKYGTDVLNPVRACRVACSASFADYCEQVLAQRQPQEEASRAEWPVDHFAPYSHWLCDEDGRLLVNDLLHFERLGEELPRVAWPARVDVQALPHRNRSERAAQPDLYDARARAIVERHCASDLARFSYSFESRARQG